MEKEIWLSLVAVYEDNEVSLQYWARLEPESNRRMEDLQSSALPLCYPAMEILDVK
jgi:hypothetical protein